MAMLECVRALWTEIEDPRTMPRSVFVHSGSLRYDQNISIGSHVLKVDEPTEHGGDDVGPNPYELLLAALGACTSMTVQMYAERKQWPLHGVQVSLSYARVHAEDCAECETKVGMVDRIELGISFTGDLSVEQQPRLLDIANKCPVHRTLVSRVEIDTRLIVAGSPSP
jgi:putative redox protein